MLEDESGRIRLAGEKIEQAGLVTGIIIAVLGMETPAGDFEVIDYCFPGMAPQEQDTDDFAEGNMNVDHGKYFFL
jgi:DNA polymerase delta subunit 2